MASSLSNGSAYKTSKNYQSKTVLSIIEITTAHISYLTKSNLMTSSIPCNVAATISKYITNNLVRDGPPYNI